MIRWFFPKNSPLKTRHKNVKIETLEKKALDSEPFQVYLRGDSEDDRVSDLTGSTGDEDALGCVVLGGSGGGHGSLGDLVEAGQLVELS